MSVILSYSEIQKIDLIVSKLDIISTQLASVYKSSGNPKLKRALSDLEKVMDKLDYEVGKYSMGK